MAIKNYLDYAGLKRVLKRLLPGARKIWHGTAEEWHDLSETERDKYDQAEVVNNIGIFDEPAQYSTEEQFTGKIWIDGKKVYRKVIDGTFLNNAVLMTDVDTMVTISGTAAVTTGTEIYPISTQNAGTIVKPKANNNVLARNSASTGVYYKCILEYTKITD